MPRKLFASLEKKEKTKFISGFTLIEAMIVLLIFALIAITFYAVSTSGVKYIREAKFRLEATALANEKMEIVHNLDYDKIGTTTGVPHGDILAKETVTQNTGTYYVYTFIKYIDDPFDGQQGKTPNDTLPNDYKEVKVTVAWEDNPMTSRAVSLFSNFVPIGKEKSVGGGTLAVSILDKAGNGIPQAQVHIKNQTAGVDITTHTDDSGNISLPAAPIGNRNYLLEVSKDGYYPVTTFPPYPISTFKPVDVHASVVESTLNTKTIITDKFSKINMRTEDVFGNAISNVDFSLTGGRKKGDTPNAPSAQIFFYNQSLNSGTSGEKSLEDMTYGIYSFTFINPTSQYQFIKIDPGQNASNQFDLAPNVEMNVKAIFASKTINSLLVKVLKDSNSNPIEGASVNLKNTSLNVDITLTTNKYGQAYFPTALPALTGEIYQLKVTASGFREKSSSVTINNLVNTDVKLIAN